MKHLDRSQIYWIELSCCPEPVGYSAAQRRYSGKDGKSQQSRGRKSEESSKEEAGRSCGLLHLKKCLLRILESDKENLPQWNIPHDPTVHMYAEYYNNKQPNPHILQQSYTDMILPWRTCRLHKDRKAYFILAKVQTHIIVTFNGHKGWEKSLSTLGPSG